MFCAIYDRQHSPEEKRTSSLIDVEVTLLLQAEKLSISENLFYWIHGLRS